METQEPGQIIGMDLIEINKKQRVITAIDHFSRYLYTKLITTKQATKVLDFIKDLSKKIQIKTLLVDNEREFANKDLMEWVKDNKIDLKYAVPYYHESNGRIERANRTIRNALKKSMKPIKIALGDITEAYNKIVHRGIDITPINGLKEEYRTRILEHQE